MTAIPSPPRGMESLSPIRVLIAEDETHLGTILEQYMTARGFAVSIVAQRARRAREAADGDVRRRAARHRDAGARRPRSAAAGARGTAPAGDHRHHRQWHRSRRRSRRSSSAPTTILSKPYRMAEIDALVRRAWEKRVAHARQSRAAVAPAPVDCRAAVRDAVCAAARRAVARRARGRERIAGAGERRIRDRQGPDRAPVARAWWSSRRAVHRPQLRRAFRADARDGAVRCGEGRVSGRRRSESWG